MEVLPNLWASSSHALQWLRGELPLSADQLRSDGLTLFRVLSIWLQLHDAVERYLQFELPGNPNHDPEAAADQLRRIVRLRRALHVGGYEPPPVPAEIRSALAEHEKASTP